MQETIAAIATAPGSSALSVVRVSGETAIGTVDKAFRGGRNLKNSNANTVLHGFIVDAEEKRIDEVVVSLFLCPASFTGEDSVEITCHGGAIAGRAVLRAVLSAGARVAEPGEFTKRAFLNGKLDLAQAEAVCDIIEAKTETSMRVALRQLAGGLSSKIRTLKEEILSCRAELEARIDFPEDVGTDLPVEKLAGVLKQVLSGISGLLSQRLAGKAFRDGLRVPIVGGPNAGKSSLFNAIVGEERAIVTEVPGTTRDFIEAFVDLEGFPLALVDTAGLRETTDLVESKGVERTKIEIQRADFVIYVVDPTLANCGGSGGVQECFGGNEARQGLFVRKECLLVISKSDLEPAPGFEAELRAHEKKFGGALRTSCHRGEGISELMTALSEKMKNDFGASPEEILLTNVRHGEILERAQDEISQAISGLCEGKWDELVSFHLGEARNLLDEITGEKAGDDVLERIFSRFCVGK